MSKKLLILKNYLLLSALTVVFLAGCKTEEPTAPETLLTAHYDNSVVIEWNNLLLDVERFTPGYLPPVSARAFGYIGLAIYETAIPGMPAFKSLGNHYYGLALPVHPPVENIHFPTAINSAYAYMVEQLYPTIPAAQLADVIAMRNTLNQKYQSEVSADVFASSVEWGENVAEAVFLWSQSDAVGHEGFLRPSDPAYVPPVGEGLWKPTYPNFASALLPHWGDVRTFAASIDDKCKNPLPFSTDETSEFFVQAKETENKVNLINQGLNYEDKWIAQFWSDDCPALTFTPAGRWVAIASQALENTNANLEKSIIVTAKVGMAVCDAGIRCWGEKYRFNLLRPVEYIRDYMGNDNWNSIMCPDGSGQYFTPAFPTYPSGHGTFGSAAAEVLTYEFGQSFILTDRCHENRHDFIGTPRTFHSFYEMAVENAYSRIPIGVHYRMDAEAALDLGYKVGRRVNNLPWRK